MAEVGDDLEWSASFDGVQTHPYPLAKRISLRVEESQMDSPFCRILRVIGRFGSCLQGS